MPITEISGRCSNSPVPSDQEIGRTGRPVVEAIKKALQLLELHEEPASDHRYPTTHKLRTPQNYVAQIESGLRRVDVVEFTEYVAALGEDPMEVYRRLLDR